MRPSLVFTWESDEVCRVRLGDQLITVLTYDDLGWGGMRLAIQALTKLATAVEYPVAIEGTPGV